MIETAINAMTTHKGNRLAEISQKQPVLLVFLRHLGCVFCREAMDDISKAREEIIQRNTRVIFVHMGTEEEALPLFERFNLQDAERVSDIEQKYYQAFGLVRARTGQLASFKVFLRSFQAGVGKGLGAGKVIGDGFQMPGVFVVHKGQKVGHYIHKDASDRPDYLALIDQYINR